MVTWRKSWGRRVTSRDCNGCLAKPEHEAPTRSVKKFRGYKFPRMHVLFVTFLVQRSSRKSCRFHGRIRIVASINLCEASNASYIIVNLPASFLFATHASHLNTYTDIKCNDCRSFWPRRIVRLSVDNAL